MESGAALSLLALTLIILSSDINATSSTFDEQSIITNTVRSQGKEEVDIVKIAQNVHW
jgi:hypothetical protein